MKKAGLTLVEILCVIAIASVLLAMLLPVFAKAKQAAKEVSATQNLKNLYIATALYREEQVSSVEYGDPYLMGLPSPEAMIRILEQTSGKDIHKQSPCGRHPRLDEEFGGYATVYFIPQDPSLFAAYVRKHESNTPLWVDPNCNSGDIPIRLKYGLKKVIGVMLDGHIIKKQKADRPFWNPSFFE